MPRKHLLIICSIILTGACTVDKSWNPILLEQESSNLKIAFGSCAHSYDTLNIFNAIHTEQPDLWVWLGDIVYGDTHDMNVLKEKYDKQKRKIEYQQVLNNSKVIGVWDDHDYGINDGGKFYSMKRESKELLLDFLDTDMLDPVRTRDGAYADYTLIAGNKKVKIILLDTRYFRDTLEADLETTARYLPNPTGDILGEEQWRWLEETLTNSDADLHIIGTGIQLIAEEQGYEKWANFPRSRQQLFNLLVESPSTPTLIISGDRHIAELSKIEIPDLGYPLYDFTASGLTHTWGMPWPEPNKFRVDSLIFSKNFGLINIDFSADSPIVALQVRNELNEILLQHTIEY